MRTILPHPLPTEEEAEEGEEGDSVLPSGVALLYPEDLHEVTQSSLPCFTRPPLEVLEPIGQSSLSNNSLPTIALRLVG